MAQFCDQQAAVHGEVIPEAPSSSASVEGEGEGDGRDVGRELADRVAVEGGDCCVPKSKSRGTKES
jgi:4a-hydroxytetrahydrobiopterin dehydratase